MISSGSPRGLTARTPATASNEPYAPKRRSLPAAEPEGQNAAFSLVHREKVMALLGAEMRNVHPCRRVVGRHTENLPDLEGAEPFSSLQDR